MFERAKGYFSLNMVNEAYQDVDLATNLNPFFEKAQLLKANLLWELERPDDLLITVNEVIKLNPKSAEAYLLGGKARFKKGDLKMAIYNFNRALELNPDYKEAYLQIGSCYVAQGELHKACGKFKEAAANGQTVSFTDLCH